MGAHKLWLAVVFLASVPLEARPGGEDVMTSTGMEAVDYEDLDGVGFSFANAVQLPEFPTDKITQALVGEIERGARFCAQLPRIEYSLDCLSDRMAFTARLVPRIRGYSELRSALIESAREIRQLARRNRSADLPTGSAKLEEGRTRPLIPFDSSKRSFIENATEEIVARASSKMWRVAGQSRETRSHYEAFASAVDEYYIFRSPRPMPRG